MLTVRDIHFSRDETVILDGIDLHADKGSIVAIMGPSGCGKTTLLKVICGQLAPDQGSVHIHGQNVHRLKADELNALRKNMGVLFQSGALFTNLSVFDNVAFPYRMHTQLSESMIHDLVLMKLEIVGLRGAKDLFPRALSGGMARRVALARAIALDPSLVLYDEPFTGLDPIGMGVCRDLIKTLNQTLGLTSIIVSHDVEITASIADEVYILANKKVMAHGTPQELIQSKANDVKQFMQGLADGPVPFHMKAKPFEQDLMA